jgi:beta-lactamase regulating signal transducer with metallopeptidase domain
MTPIPEVWSALIAGLLSGLVPALAVAGAAWVLLKISPCTNAATRYAVWWLVLAVAVLLPLGFAAGGVNRMRVQARVPPVAPAFEPASSGVFVRRAAVSTPAVSAPSPQAAPLRLRAGGWSGWLTILWTGLFAAGMGRLGWSYRRLRGIKRRSSAAPPELSDSFRRWVAAFAIRRPVRLLVSDEVATPVAAGFRHPAVIVPGRVVGEFGRTEIGRAHV